MVLSIIIVLHFRKSMRANVDLDLLRLVGRDTRLRGRPSAATNGGEWKARCPLPGCTSTHDALCVWPHHPSGRGRWWCRACGRGGDAVAWLVAMGRISPQEAGALRRAGAPAAAPVAVELPAAVEPPVAVRLPAATGRRAAPETEKPAEPEPAQPPGPAWQAAARAFAAHARAALWSEAGTPALAWLRGRGLADDTIRAAGLGWNPANLWRPAQRWGLDGGRVWLPRGWVIPWEIDGQIWRLNVRRPDEDLAGERRSGRQPAKYIGPRRPPGCGQALYNADALLPGRPAVVVEGELDALTVAQEAGDLAAAVALGSTAGARRRRWIAALAICSPVLVALDADPDPNKGERAAAWWVHRLPNARRLRPWWADANQMHQDGASVRAWVQAALRGELPAASSKQQVSICNLELACDLDAALPCRIEDWPALRARLGGLPGARLAWPEGEPGLVAICPAPAPSTIIDV